MGIGEKSDRCELNVIWGRIKAICGFDSGLREPMNLEPLNGYSLFFAVTSL